jgi:hypothetical protein
LLSLPAAAQIQYFGYVGGADDDLSLSNLNGFANFAHLSTPADLASTFVRDRVNALSQKGWKATIDLGLVLWCDYDGNGSYRSLCWDWVQRWTTWKQNNASILTADKVLAFDILDEPFNRGTYMTDFETAAQRVKADFPWAKTWMTEAACVIAGTCSSNWPSPGLGGYQGSLPGIDWLGLDAYGIHPSTDWAYQNARTTLKGRFPGRKWIYVLDGYWDPNLHGVNLSSMYDMGAIADEWYNLARNDADAVLLGAFLWPAVEGWTTSRQFSCDILNHHVTIGRAITHKARPQTALPIGSFSVDFNGNLSGWACDPDGTLCETPQIDLYSDGVSYGSVFYGATQDALATSQCSSGIAYRFTRTLNVGASGHRIIAVARPASGTASSTPPRATWTTSTRRGTPTAGSAIRIRRRRPARCGSSPAAGRSASTPPPSATSRQ